MGAKGECVFVGKHSNANKTDVVKCIVFIIPDLI